MPVDVYFTYYEAHYMWTPENYLGYQTLYIVLVRQAVTMAT
jgi:hypothetical protein